MGRGVGLWRQSRGTHTPKRRNYSPSLREVVVLITADAGGSNGYRTRLWKVELQKRARDTGLLTTVAHYPPGTSQWNRIEHRMFSFITQDWRDRLLLSVQTVVSLIANTTTNPGLKIKAALDTRAYDTDVTVPTPTSRLLTNSLPPSTCDQVASTATGAMRAADRSAQSERFAGAASALSAATLVGSAVASAALFPS